MSLIITFRNISQLAPVSDYEYRVLVGDGTPERSRTITSGVIKEHTRTDGWMELVQMLLDKEG